MNTTLLYSPLRACLWSGAILILLHGATRAATADEIERTFKVRPGGSLVIEADRGSINVETVDADTLTIHVTRRVQKLRGNAEELLTEHEVTFSEEGDQVVVRGGFPKKTSWMRIENIQVRYRVTAPKRFNVRLKTSGGSISITDLEGNADVKTSGGSLNLGKIRGEIRGRTSGGGISIEGCNRDVDVSTSGGGIRIGNAAGNVLARTSGGSITLEDVGGSVEASTSGGSIKARLAKQPSGDCSLKTSGGGIHLTLPADVAIDLDARTSGGRVTSDLPGLATGERSRTSLKASLNGGGPKVVAHTSGGGVKLQAR